MGKVSLEIVCKRTTARGPSLSVKGACTKRCSALFHLFTCSL